MGQVVGVREYARRRGVSHTAVSHAIRAGRLSKSVTRDARNWPRIDVELADAEWDENTTPADARGQPGPGEKRDGKPESRPAGKPVQHDLIEGATPEKPTAGRSKSSALAQVQAVRVGYQARLAGLEYRKRAGQLAELGSIRAAIASIFTDFRENVLNVPDQCAPELAADTTPDGCRALLRAELMRMLEDLADELERAAEKAAADEDEV